jgi:MYXO-CTERM domain-containing protein
VAVDAAVADTAVAVDSASVEAGVPCGQVTFLGECDGDTVRYCARDNQLVEVDCADEFGSGATCGLADCTADGCLGYFCVARNGQACDEILGCDVGAGQGCVDGTCAGSTACDPDAFTPTCDGDLLSYCAYTVGRNDCSEGDTQPYVCGNTSAGTPGCLGTAGGLCDPSNGFECATGFDCVDNVCTAPGTDAGGIDSGSAADAASGDDDDDAEAGCGCRASGAGSSVALLLAGLLGLARRRRR